MKASTFCLYNNKPSLLLSDRPGGFGDIVRALYHQPAVRSRVIVHRDREANGIRRESESVYREDYSRVQRLTSSGITSTDSTYKITSCCYSFFD